MIFGMTRGEIGLVIFLFALIYVGVIVPKMGARLGAYLASGSLRRSQRRDVVGRK